MMKYVEQVPTNKQLNYLTVPKRHKNTDFSKQLILIKYIAKFGKRDSQFIHAAN